MNLLNSPRKKIPGYATGVTLAVNGDEWFAPRPVRLTPMKGAPIRPRGGEVSSEKQINLLFPLGTE